MVSCHLIVFIIPQYSGNDKLLDHYYSLTFFVSCPQILRVRYLHKNRYHFQTKPFHICYASLLRNSETLSLFGSVTDVVTFCLHIIENTYFWVLTYNWKFFRIQDQVKILMKIVINISFAVPFLHVWVGCFFCEDQATEIDMLTVPAGYHCQLAVIWTFMHSLLSSGPCYVVPAPAATNGKVSRRKMANKHVMCGCNVVKRRFIIWSTIGQQK